MNLNISHILWRVTAWFSKACRHEMSFSEPRSSFWNAFRLCTQTSVVRRQVNVLIHRSYLREKNHRVAVGGRRTPKKKKKEKDLERTQLLHIVIVHCLAITVCFCFFVYSCSPNHMAWPSLKTLESHGCCCCFFLCYRVCLSSVTNHLFMVCVCVGVRNYMCVISYLCMMIERRVKRHPSGRVTSCVTSRFLPKGGGAMSRQSPRQPF